MEMTYKNAKEARELRQSLREQELKVLADVREAGEMSAENREKLDKMDVDFRQLNKDIDLLERAEKRKAEEAVKSGEEKKITETENDKLRRYLLTGEIPADRREKRANVQSTTTTLGGYTIDSIIGPNIAQAMAEYGGMLGVSLVVPTSGGNQLEWPTVDDTAQKGDLLLEGNSAASELGSGGATAATAATFGQTLLNAYKYSSGMLQINRELIEDSEFDIASFILNNLLVERVMRKINAVTTTGTGSSQPKGAVTCATYGEVLTASAAYTRADILNLVHSLDPAYRRNGTMMMNDSILKVVRSITDDYGQPLYAPDPRLGAPSTVEGMPIVVNQDMATAAAAAKTIIVGDFSRFVIRLAGGFRLVVTDQLYAATDQIGVAVFARVDSDILNSGAIKYGYQSAT